MIVDTKYIHRTLAMMAIGAGVLAYMNNFRTVAYVGFAVGAYGLINGEYDLI